MLQLTSNAVSAIAALTGNQQPPDEAGLRIAPTEDGSAMTATAATGSEADERIVEQGGVRVFLAPTIVDVLADKVLDAQVDDGGKVGFYVAPQSSPSPPA